ncbi:hypothetical protein MTR67_043757 [Solanum verrucosum]|uniref:Uncharacterized protein n=1 Tax=Solanum verrucosum TaxID=315347 RepID=A0AAF0ZSB8_SOLVR|nr:hypothetical protein MTR67_043757 [Solanum verrucosum]
MQALKGVICPFHPRATKMCCDLQEIYWWNEMKKDIVVKCPNCQKDKAEHHKLGGLSQDISLPTWKWEDLNVDVIVGFPLTRQQHDYTWVIVD